MRPPDDPPGQLRLPFAGFIPERAHRRMWKVAPLPGRRCPHCGCTPESPCMFTVDGAIGRCVPAGQLGLTVCSRCVP